MVESCHFQARMWRCAARAPRQARTVRSREALCCWAVMELCAALPVPSGGACGCGGQRPSLGTRRPTLLMCSSFWCAAMLIADTQKQPLIDRNARPLSGFGGWEKGSCQKKGKAPAAVSRASRAEVPASVSKSPAATNAHDFPSGPASTCSLATMPYASLRTQSRLWALR